VRQAKHEVASRAKIFDRALVVMLMARLPHVSASELAPERQALLVSKLQGGKPLNLYATLGNNPAMLEGMRSYFGAMWAESGLSDRERELLILTVAEEVDSEYERHQHRNVAPDVGVTDEELDAIVAGESDLFSDEETLLLRYGRAVVRGDVTDKLHERLVTAFGEEAVLGAANVSGAYLGLARVIDALGIDPEGGIDE
jgi:alkylhydroperoxidase family enzyme